MDLRNRVSELRDDHGYREMTARLNAVLADLFVLYLKTKNFHWHVSGPNFREYHLLLDDQANQILGTTDQLAERVRKIGGTTLKSIGDVARRQRLADSDGEGLLAQSMLAELLEDNGRLGAELLHVHALAEGAGDIATAGLLEVWLDEAQGRAWFLRETLDSDGLDDETGVCP